MRMRCRRPLFRHCAGMCRLQVLVRPYADGCGSALRVWRVPSVIHWCAACSAACGMQYRNGSILFLFTRTLFSFTPGVNRIYIQCKWKRLPFPSKAGWEYEKPRPTDCEIRRAGRGISLGHSCLTRVLCASAWSAGRPCCQPKMPEPMRTVLLPSCMAMG